MRNAAGNLEKAVQDLNGEWLEKQRKVYTVWSSFDPRQTVPARRELREMRQRVFRRAMLYGVGLALQGFSIPSPERLELDEWSVNYFFAQPNTQRREARKQIKRIIRETITEEKQRTQLENRLHRNGWVVTKWMRGKTKRMHDIAWSSRTNL